MRALAVALSVAVVTAVVVPAPSYAESVPRPPVDEVVTGPDLATLDVETLEEELEDDALALSGVDVTSTAIEVGVTATLASGAELDTSAALDVRDSTFELAFNSDGAAVADGTLTLQVLELDETSVVVEFQDPGTGETVRYEDGTGELAAIPLVIGIPIGISLLKALFAATAVVVVAGVTYVVATEAIKAIQSRGSSYQHFAALRRSSGLFIGNGMSLNSAIQRGRVGSDTWSRSSSGARAVAYGVNNRTPVGPEIDASGSNKHWHYHPSNRRPAMHAFYGSPR